MSGRVLRLPINTQGRDFVIGDIHGAYDLVKRGMRAVQFDQARDRLFCVGDLIDRGPDSHRCLEFMKQPYVYACRGNHDADFLQVDLAGLRVLGQVNWQGLGWVNEVPDRKLEEIRRHLAQLPLVIEIETARGLVGLVHADVPEGLTWQEFTQYVEAGNEDVIKIALESRVRVKTQNQTGVPGIGRVFVGHSIKWEGPAALGNVFAIDTGAVFYELDEGNVAKKDSPPRGSLTMLNLQFRTQTLANVQSGVDGLRVLDNCGAGPFGTSTVDPPPARERQRA